MSKRLRDLVCILETALVVVLKIKGKESQLKTISSEGRREWEPEFR